MPTPLDRDRVSRHLQSLNLRELFIGELGWDHGGEDPEVKVAGRTFALEAVAHKRGLVVYRYLADSDDAFPGHPVRQKIERAVAGSVREHLVVYATSDRSTQCWQWVKREAGRPDLTRTHIYGKGQSGEALIQKLDHLVFTLEEEEGITIVDPSSRVRAAFDVEKVTKRFYDRFKQEHEAFLDFIEGITAAADREWYASLMLNRMMFIYFIQKRSFLDGDPDYLRNRLERVRREQGHGKFHSFYRVFLLRLFHEGLGRPEADRAPELAALLGEVPYLNGGLFDVHALERHNPDIHIPDDAFERVFAFFEAYQWHLDDRPLRNDNEINPDVLGYIFEKYVNQKQMGAYYSKEDITGYHKWYKEEEPRLLELVRYERLAVSSHNDIVPKLQSRTEQSIYQKALAQSRTLGMSVSRGVTANRIYYKITGVGHWFTFTMAPPRFWREGVEGSSTRESSVCFSDSLARDTAFCCLWSTLHYWLYQACTNCRDYNPSDLASFPIPESVEAGIEEFQPLARRIAEELERTSYVAEATYRVGGTVQYQRFSLHYSRRSRFDRQRA